MKFTILPQKPAGQVAKEGALVLGVSLFLATFLNGPVIGDLLVMTQLYGFLMLLAALWIYARGKSK